MVQAELRESGTEVPMGKVRLNIQLEEEEMEEFKAQAKAAGYTTLAEYVRHALKGKIVVVGSESPGKGKARKVAE
jgi:hypothetical protein